MLYGAYGFTGQLIVEEAVRRGHRPVLAGRDAARVAEVARRHDLDWLALDLDYAQRLVKTVERYDLVFHAAGPFIHTAPPMQRACLDGRTHYLDITGEIPVFEQTFAHDAEARRRDVLLMSGVGFDIVPTDCLAAYVAAQTPDATHLETAIYGGSSFSSGTARSALGMAVELPGGTVVRRDGRLVGQPIGRGGRDVRFSDGRERSVLPFPWGDAVTAYHTTGIPNITSYLAFPDIPGLSLVSGPALRLLKLGPVQRAADQLASLAFPGPDAETRRTARTFAWARAAAPDGSASEAWLETVETYRFTALAGVRSVERALAAGLSGALTPAEAFGADFVLEIEGTRRFDTLAQR